MWIALTVPLALLGCAVAIVPVLYGSIRVNRSEATLRTEARPTPITESTQAPSQKLEVVCPPCGAVLRGTESAQLFEEVSHHAWRVHGVPQPDRVLREAVPATV